jgi:hypothetical protein
VLSLAWKAAHWIVVDAGMCGKKDAEKIATFDEETYPLPLAIPSMVTRQSRDVA